jgi:rubredoxin
MSTDEATSSSSLLTQKRKLYDEGKQLTEEYMSLKKDVSEMKRASKVLRMSIEKSEEKVQNFSKTLHDFLSVALENVVEIEEDHQQDNEKQYQKKTTKETTIRKYKEIPGNWICPSCSKPIKPTSEGKVKKTHSKNNMCTGRWARGKRTTEAAAMHCTIAQNRLQHSKKS